MSFADIMTPILAITSTLVLTLMVYNGAMACVFLHALTLTLTLMAYNGAHGLV